MIEPKTLYFSLIMLLLSWGGLVYAILRKEKYERARQMNIVIFTLSVIVWGGLAIFAATGPDKDVAITIFTPAVVVFVMVPMILSGIARVIFFRK